MVERISISKSSDPCSDDQNYSFTSCIFSYVTRSVGCKIPWIYTDLIIVDKFPDCKTKAEMDAFDNLLANVETRSGYGIANMTGCPIKCRVRQYSISECKSELVSWKRQWSSAFYLGADRTEVRREEEFWIFDSSDTLNGIGGALGLFLGWSVLYLINQLVAGVVGSYRHILSIIPK